jgi:hypothetical protein
MKRPWFWLGVAPVAAIAILVFATTFGVAHEGDDSADVEREAVKALGSGCSTIMFVSRREITPEAVESEAKQRGITGSGWVNSRFIGSPQELAASKGATVAASGRSSAWTLAEDASGEKSVRQYLRFELPSGKVAWMPGKIISSVPCQ